VVGHAADLDDLEGLCELLHPGMVLVDLGDGIGDCLEGLTRLRRCLATARVVGVYETLSSAELATLSRVGVDTLVPYSHGLDALLAVMHNFLLEDPDMSAYTTADGLTERQREILTLVSAGHTVDRIADLLDISTSAVMSAKRRIYDKLEVASQSQAAARAAVLGINGRSISVVAPQRDSRAVVILRCANNAVRPQIASVLLAGGMPFSIGRQHRAAEAVDFEGARPLFVLVDPDPDDWPDSRERDRPVALVRTGQPRRADTLEALLRGAVVVVTADRIATDLVPALTLAAHGYLAVEASAASALLDAVLGSTIASSHGLPELTSRECDILRSIADGHTVRQTGRVLGIATKTVENTQARLFRKLVAHNRSGALFAAHA
jgi:two-component system nitrate/nitrite response regulator NarL